MKITMIDFTIVIKNERNHLDLNESFQIPNYNTDLKIDKA